MIQQNQVVWRGAATYITTNLLQWNKSSVEWLLLQLFSGRSEVKKWYAVKSKRRPTHALLKDVLHSNCLVLFTSYIYIYIPHLRETSVVFSFDCYPGRVIFLLRLRRNCIDRRSTDRPSIHFFKKCLLNRCRFKA